MLSCIPAPRQIAATVQALAVRGRQRRICRADLPSVGNCRRGCRHPVHTALVCEGAVNNNDSSVSRCDCNRWIHSLGLNAHHFICFWVSHTYAYIHMFIRIAFVRLSSTCVDTNAVYVSSHAYAYMYVYVDMHQNMHV